MYKCICRVHLISHIHVYALLQFCVCCEQGERSLITSATAFRLLEEAYVGTWHKWQWRASLLKRWRYFTICSKLLYQKDKINIVVVNQSNQHVPFVACTKHVCTCRCVCVRVGERSMAHNVNEEVFTGGGHQLTVVAETQSAYRPAVWWDTEQEKNLCYDILHRRN